MRYMWCVCLNDYSLWSDASWWISNPRAVLVSPCTIYTYTVPASPRSPGAAWSPAPPWRRLGGRGRWGYRSSTSSSAWSWWWRWCQDTALDNTHTQPHFGWLEHLEKKMEKYLPIYLLIPRFHWWKEKSLSTFVSAQEKGELFSILGLGN